MCYAERALDQILAHAVERGLPAGSTLAVVGHCFFLNGVALLYAQRLLAGETLSYSAAQGAARLVALEGLRLGEAEAILIGGEGLYITHMTPI